MSPDSEVIIKPPGVTLVKVLQDDHRFLVMLVEHNGELRIYKAAKSSEYRLNLAHDIRSSLFLEMLTGQNPDAIFRPRTFYAYNLDEGWFIGEHFDVSPLFAQEPIESESEAETRVTTYLAPFLYEVSTYTPQFQNGSAYSATNIRPEMRPRRRLRELQQWADHALQHGALNHDDAKTFLKYIKENLHHIKIGIELHDLEIWEMFLLNDGTLGVIDLEFVDIAGKRHFDVVWHYFGLWLVNKSPGTARKLLQEYCSLANEGEEFEKALMCMMLMKLIGVLYDGVNQQLDYEKTGSQQPFLQSEAMELVPHFRQLKLADLL